MKNKKPYNSQTNSDAHINDMFRDFQAPYDPESWDILSQKMDSAIPFVPLNESEIKEELGHLAMPFDAASWSVLEGRLDLYDTRKRWIFRGKILELTMFFFVFYLFAGSFSQAFELNQKEVDIAIENTNIPERTNKAQNSIDQNGEAAIASVLPTKQTESDKTINNFAPGAGQKALKLAESNSAPIEFKEQQKSSKSSSELSNQPTPITSDVIAESISHSSETIKFPTTTSEAGQVSENYLIKDESSNLLKLPLLPSQIEQENLEQKDLILPVLYPGDFNDKKFSFLVGAVVGYDKDLIKSPFPHQKSEVMLGRIEDNFRMGLNVSMEMNSIEITSGVHYLIKNYKSVYAGENQVRIASIPLMLKVKLPFAGFMRGYVSGGVSGNYVIHANYQEHDYFRDRPQLDYIENNMRGAGYSLLSSTNYKNGIFEGETVRGNHFYTANIGIGLEAHLNKTYSLFFEQAYSHHLKGSAIGPAFDHFFSSTTLMGLRFRIFKNSNRILHSKTSNSLR